MTRVMHGYPWHAGNIADLLADITVAEARARPVAGVHSIWELVLHMTGWANEVTSRVKGRPAGTPSSGNWPKTGPATLARWTAARKSLAVAYQKLDAALLAVPDADLDHPVVDRRTDPAGAGLSRYVTIHGAIHHAVYHTGQIAILKKALRTSKRGRP